MKISGAATPLMHSSPLHDIMGMIMRCKTLTFSLALLWTLFVLSARALSQQEGTSSPPANLEGLTLAQATICEEIRENTPHNQGVVFPVSIGRVICLTSFDPVPRRTVVYHNWYYRDELVTRLKLTLKPPRWATRSSIQLREADKGPWRVEVTDQKGQVFRILRFSITD